MIMKISTVNHTVNNEMFSIKLSIENLYELLEQEPFGKKEKQFMKELLEILSSKFSSIEKLLKEQATQNVDGVTKA
jgi:hypothetical protein